MANLDFGEFWQHKTMRPILSEWLDESCGEHPVGDTVHDAIDESDGSRIRLLSDNHRIRRAIFVGLNDAIEASESLLDLRDNWDDDGAKAISRETWTAATDLSRRYARYLFERFGLKVEGPSFTPGPDGSIDLNWKSSDRELLLNFEHGGVRATFYGQDGRGNFVKGSFDPGLYNQGILTWLMNR
jgi:hypothetical protein